MLLLFLCQKNIQTSELQSWTCEFYSLFTLLLRTIYIYDVQNASRAKKNIRYVFLSLLYSLFHSHSFTLHFLRSVHLAISSFFFFLWLLSFYCIPENYLLLNGMHANDWMYVLYDVYVLVHVWGISSFFQIRCVCCLKRMGQLA